MSENEPGKTIADLHGALVNQVIGHAAEVCGNDRDLLFSVLTVAARYAEYGLIVQLSAMTEAQRQKMLAEKAEQKAGE